MAFWNKKPPPQPVDWRERVAKLPSMFVASTEFPGKKKAPIVATPKQIGVLTLPTGRIVTGDAIGNLELTPLSRQAPAGEFPIEISLAELSRHESRIAALRVVFSQAPVATWEPATGGTGAKDPAPNGTYGYTGPLGVIMDEQAAALFEKFVDDRDGAEWWYDVPKTEGKLFEYGCFRPDDDRPETCAIFQTGDDDPGVCVSYWGLDTAGAVVTFVTDFNVIP